MATTTTTPTTHLTLGNGMTACGRSRHHVARTATLLAWVSCGTCQRVGPREEDR